MAKNDSHMTALLIVAIVAIVGIVGLMGGGSNYAKITGYATNFTNITETLNLNCTTWIAINDYEIAASGYVLQDCYNATVFTDNSSEQYCWGPDNSSFLDFISIENKGNNHINVTVWITNDAGNFFGTTGNDLLVRADNGNSSAAYGTDDTNASCEGNLQSSWITLKPVTTVVSLCDDLDWPIGNDELVFFDEFRINVTTPPGTYTFTKTVAATQVSCGEGVGVLTWLGGTTDGTAYEIDAAGNFADVWTIGSEFGSYGVTPAAWIDFASNGPTAVFGITATEIVEFDVTPVDGANYIQHSTIGAITGTPVGLTFDVSINPVLPLLVSCQTPNCYLYDIDPSDGSVNLMATITGVDDITAVAPKFDATYVYVARLGTGSFYTLNTGTGALTNAVALSSGATGTPYYGGAFNPAAPFIDMVDNAASGVLTTHILATGADGAVSTFPAKTPRALTKLTTPPT